MSKKGRVLIDIFLVNSKFSCCEFHTSKNSVLAELGNATIITLAQLM